MPVIANNGPAVNSVVECVPGATERCKLYWTTQMANATVTNCTYAERVCLRDGRGWSACGEDEASTAAR